MSLSDLAKQHAQLCEGVVELAGEVEHFQAYCETLVSKLHELQSQALAVSLPLQNAVATPAVSSGATGEQKEAEKVDVEQVQVEVEAEESEKSTDEESTGAPYPKRRVSMKATTLDSQGLGTSEPEAKDIHMDDLWTERFFLNEKEAEDELEKIYLQVRSGLKSSESVLRKKTVRCKPKKTASRSGSAIALEVVNRCNSQPFIVHPTSRIRVAWDVLGFWLLAWDIANIPVRVCFGMGTTPWSFEHVWWIITSIYWTADVVLNFFTSSYSSEGKLRTSLIGIAKAYGRKWLCPDIVVLSLDWTVAHYMAADNALGGVRGILGCARLVRMGKLARLGKDFDDFLISHGKADLAMFFALLKIGMQLFVMVHLFTCLLYFEGRMQEEAGAPTWISEYYKAHQGWKFRYMKSFHWMLCQFSPAPFPEWEAQNTLEQALLLSMIVFGLPVIGSSLSRLIALVGEINAKASERTRITQQFKHYIVVYKFPPELSSKALRFVENKLKQKNAQVGKPDALALLPPQITTELTLSRMGQALTIHPFISLVMEAKLDVVSDLFTGFHLQSFEPNSEVFHFGSASSCMYITSQGAFELRCRIKANTMGDMAASSTDAASKIRRGSTNSMRGSTNGDDDAGDVSEMLGSCTFNASSTTSSTLDGRPSVQHASTRSSANVKPFHHPQWFSELSLFLKFTHTSTLATMTFGDVYNISVADFADAIQKDPIAAVAAYEYANSLVSCINRGDLEFEDFLAPSDCTDACASTQLSEAMFPGRGGGDMTVVLSRIPQRTSEDMGDMQQFVAGLLGETTMSDLVLQEQLPELHETLGTYCAFQHLDERKNCVLSIFSAVWLAKDDYDAITSVQKEEVRLKRETWAKLQDIVKWIDVDTDMLHGVVVFLAIRGLGKSKLFNRMCPPPARSCPEYGIAYAMKAMKHLVPSVHTMPRHIFGLVKSALSLNKNFNFGQFVQGENIPYNVARLEEAVNEEGEEEGEVLLKFYLYVMVCMMAGLTGKATLNGSIFLNEVNTTNLLNALQVLKSVGTKDPRIVYWGYVGKRAKQLGLKRSSPEERAFARLICQSRVTDKKGLTVLDDAWSKLDTDNKTSLVKWLTADGITTQSVILSFLPNYLGSSISNGAVGLYFALLNLLDLLDRCEDYMDKAQAKMYIVDLAGLAALITEVKTPQGLCECIKNVKILRKETRIYLVLTQHCRQLAIKTDWKQTRDRSRGEAKIDHDQKQSKAIVERQVTPHSTTRRGMSPPRPWEYRNI